MNSVQDIYKIRKQMEKIHKKFTLLNKKQTSFGLSAEEEEKLKQYRSESWILHEELIEVTLNLAVMPYLITQEYTDALKEIQSIIPWNGGLIRRDGELERLVDRALELRESDRQLLADKLEFIHVCIVQRFELFCSTEEGYRHIQDASKVITTEEDGNVLDVLVYLDARYRELAEMLDIELQEVEVKWEDEDE